MRGTRSRGADAAESPATSDTAGTPDEPDVRVTVTVFTPTYRRAETLHRPYESLRAQTFEDFEWVVVDDDSDDGTAALVGEWRETADFPIEFYVQGPDERGKHRAHNRALDLASGRFFLTLDSDDRLRPDALARLLEVWEGIPTGRRDRYVGVAALMADETGATGGRFPEETFDGGYFDLRYGQGKVGETVSLDRTSVLRAYPYPDVEGARFLPESTVQSRIHRTYLTRYVDEVLAEYHADSGDDQLTSVSNLRDSPAFAYWHAVRLDEHGPWFREDPRSFLVSAVGFVRHSLHAGDGYLAQFHGLSTPFARVLWLLALVPGTLVYLRDVIRGS